MLPLFGFALSASAQLLGIERRLRSRWGQGESEP
jgi:hypothetical protein